MQTDEMRGMQVGIRKGAWTVEEDYKLINYINAHGQGHWNLLAQSAGLKRSGRSCRLRWMNYLRPGVKHGNLTLQEQFIILHCHCCWGNRWSKIANHLPGRTDNEIKNYWRTRIQKQAHQLNCQPNSQEFRDAIRYILLPKLLEQIEAGSSILNSTSNHEPATSSFNNIANTMTTFDTSSHDLSKDQVFSCDSNFYGF